MKEVTAAIIMHDHLMLIAQRGPGQNLAGKWEFPGGKIEPGETPEACLTREIKEELDIDIEVVGFFAESIYRYEAGQIRLLAFTANWIGGELQAKEHSQIRWINREQLADFDFAPADRPFVEQLRRAETALNLK